MVAFLIETDAVDPEASQRIYYSAIELGHEVITTELGRPAHEKLDGVKEPVVFFGSLNTIRKLQELNLPQKPLSWCDWNALSCHHYYARYSKYIFQQEYNFCTFGELLEAKDNLYKSFGDRNRIFIRPTTNDKVFTGEVVGEPQFEYWYKMAQIYDPSPELLCVVSKPRAIHTEYRFVVADGKVISGSQYKIGGMIQSLDPYNQVMVDFVEKVVSEWQPHPIFVFDIAITRDEKIYVMEIGPVNGAGLYKCEVKPIVEAMADIAERG